jgi:hypothetical protein
MLFTMISQTKKAAATNKCALKNRVVALRNRFPKLALKMHETDPLLSSSKLTNCVERTNATIKAEELS